MNISSLSQLGFCQAAFLFSYTHKIVTKDMLDSLESHKNLTRYVEPFRIDDVKRIRSGEIFSAREISVADRARMLIGRIDQIDFCGFQKPSGNVNVSVVYDDKFPRDPRNFFGLNDVHRIQLSSYVLALENDSKFKDIVKVFFAMLRVWEKNRVVSKFDANRHELGGWVKNIPELVETGNKILAKRAEPKPLAFSVDNNKWIEVGNRCSGCKYNNICEYRRI